MEVRGQKWTLSSTEAPVVLLCYGSWGKPVIHALMNCRDVWLLHLVLVCCSSSNCTSCCSVCDQLLFGSGHSSDNQRRERCSMLLCMWVWVINVECAYWLPNYGLSDVTHYMALQSAYNCICNLLAYGLYMMFVWWFVVCRLCVVWLRNMGTV